MTNIQNFIDKNLVMLMIFLNKHTQNYYKIKKYNIYKLLMQILGLISYKQIFNQLLYN